METALRHVGARDAARAYVGDAGLAADRPAALLERGEEITVARPCLPCLLTNRPLREREDARPASKRHCFRQRACTGRF